MTALRSADILSAAGLGTFCPQRLIKVPASSGCLILRAIPGSRPDVAARLRLEFACALYQSELASFASAAVIAGGHPFLFGHELSRHGIARHYGEEETSDDRAYVESRRF